MAFKCELTDLEIAIIKNALRTYGSERLKMIKTGKFMGKKVVKSTIEAARKTIKDIDKLLEFFES